MATRRNNNKKRSGKFVPRYSWLLLTTIIIATSISAQSSDRKWKLGSSGKVKWSNNCDFFGGDYAKQTGFITSSKCEEFCVSDNRCTHFTSNLSSGKCFLKTMKGSIVKEKMLSGAYGLTTICGYVTDRPIEWRLAGINGTYKWGYCDFPKLDIESSLMENSTKCGNSCLGHNRCTHFVHFNGKCYLKTISGPARKPIYKPDRICGFLVERKLTKDWVSSHNGRINSAINCDFPGYDIEKIILTSNNKTVCPDKCLANKRCTHFVHSTPILPHQCILKEIRGKSVVEMMNEKAPLCGYVAWYDFFGHA